MSQTPPGLIFFRAGLVACLFLALALPLPLAAQSNAPAASVPEAAPPSETVRSLLQIQDQLHDAQLQLEAGRKEAENAAARSAELLDARLSLIEKSVASQRLDELREMQASNRQVLVAAGAFALVGFLILLCTALLQWNAVKRLAAVAGINPAGHAALGFGDLQLGAGPAAEQSSARLLGTIERLEKRILEMEDSLHSRPSLAAPASANGGHQLAESSDASPPGSQSAASGQSAAAHSLLGKGETLLKLDQPEAALACFDELLALEPANAEALVRKGSALERLQRLDDALACYDRAIAADRSMTMAWLYKGGVFNRMERYSEALECYEQALRSQDKGAPPRSLPALAPASELHAA